MKILIQKLTGITGAISALFGGIGAAVAGFGLCACVLAPVLSIAGILSLIAGFLSSYKLFFLITGIVLLLISLVFYSKRKTCRLHKKFKKTGGVH